ncbi:MAG: hypothetical protein HZC24_15205 [Rhodocyclales bacterium]|nr:hypothetical protein [Rhodocyclales bacterium]
MKAPLSGKAVERIVRALRETPGLTRAEIAARAYVGASTLSGGGYLKTMKLAGLIHISGWRRNASSAFTTPLYSAGQAEDCERPRVTKENRCAPGMERLLDAIRELGPIDYRRAAQIAGLSPHTVKNAGYLEALVSQRKIHISDWRRGRNGPMRAIYEFGAGKEAPQPPPRSHAEIMRQHRRRKLALSQNLAVQARMAAGA